MPSPDDEPGIDVHLDSVFRSAMQRVLVVLGTVEAEIRYDAGGWGERVIVNGELAAQTSGFMWSWRLMTVVPRVHFHLTGGGLWVPARVDVSIYHAFWKGIKDFRLVVADRVVYEEQDRQIVIPEDPTGFSLRPGSV